MQPAKKFDDDEIASPGQSAERLAGQDDVERLAGQDDVWPASPSAGAVQRHSGDGPGTPSDQADEQPISAAELEIPATGGDEPPGPIGARAQQAILEQAFAEESPRDGSPTLDRAGLQGAREAAAQWNERPSLPPYFWERLARDASIFIIVFALLVFAILQAM